MLRTQRTYLAPGLEVALRAAGLYSVEAIFALTAGTIVRTSGSSEVRRIKAPSSSGPEFLFLKKYWVTRWAQLRSRVFRGRRLASPWLSANSATCPACANGA